MGKTIKQLESVLHNYFKTDGRYPKKCIMGEATFKTLCAELKKDYDFFKIVNEKIIDDMTYRGIKIEVDKKLTYEIRMEDENN